MKKRIYVVTERYHLAEESGVDVSRVDFHRLMGQSFDCTYAFVDDKGWHEMLGLDKNSIDAVFVYVRFRRIDRIMSIDWRGFDGPRILYDEDSCQNRCFHRLGRASLVGHWTKALNRLRFTNFITTDYHFEADSPPVGAQVHWLPKYYNPRYLFPLGLDREGIGYYGAAYDARKAMLESLDKKSVAPRIFRCAHEDLNEHLNKLLGCVVCNLAVTFEDSWHGKVRAIIQKIPRLRAWFHQLLPGFGVKYVPTLGTMFKNFEIPATSCAPIIDWMEELALLGYVDGETAVVYRSFEELAEKLTYYKVHPEALQAIGARSGSLTRQRHGIETRMSELQKLVESIC